jgi:hypothetical protein
MKNDQNELVALKIPALRGRDSSTNAMILELIALKGPQTIWNVNRLLERTRKQYSTIFRAITRLKKRGYLTKTGTVKMEKKRGRTPVYGLTWRGLVTSLASDNVCGNVIAALNKNSHLQLPFPRDVVSLMARELFTDEEITDLVSRLFEGFVRGIPRDIESIPEEKLGGYIFSALIETPPSGLKEMGKKDFNILLRYPTFVKWLNQMLENSEKQLEQQLEGVKKVREFLSSLKSKEEE